MLRINPLWKEIKKCSLLLPPHVRVGNVYSLLTTDVREKGLLPFDFIYKAKVKTCLIISWLFSFSMRVEENLFPGPIMSKYNFSSI